MSEPATFKEFPRFFDSGKVANPTNNQIIANSTQMDCNKVFKVMVTLSTDTAAEFQILSIASGNSTYRTATVLLQPGVVELAYYWLLNTCDQVNVVTPSGYTGNAAANINIIMAVPGPSAGWM